MMRPLSRHLSLLLVWAALSILAGCSFIYPPKFEHISSLVPKSQGDHYTLSEDGTVSYEMEGARIDIKYMMDRELNEIFPEESSQGAYSHNPYTYGNYVDPVLGYVPSRFTVFQVTVHNRSFAKVELQPLRAFLTTDRPGEVLQPYGVLSGSAPNSFESYYRALRGPSGNEFYRFDMRMGIVRTNNYEVDQKVFKGESYGGFIVFDPQDEEVEKVRLTLEDFTLRFNAFGQPMQTVDIAFDFEQQIAQQAFEERLDLASSREMTHAVLGAPSEVVGNVTGDATRDASAVDAMAKTQLDKINRCFEKEFMAGGASEGEVAMQFTILPLGAVRSARIVSSNVLSEAVDECIVEQIGRWRFDPSSGRATEGFGAPGDSLAAPAAVPLQDVSSYRVTATCFFEFIDVRE